MWNSINLTRMYNLQFTNGSKKLIIFFYTTNHGSRVHTREKITSLFIILGRTTKQMNEIVQIHFKF